MARNVPNSGGRRRYSRAGVTSIIAFALLASSVGPLPALAAPVERSSIRSAADLPLLRSDPPPKREAKTPAGNFANAPGASGLSPIKSKTPESASFDPARSTVVDDKTTPTERVFRNADGTFTSAITTRPVRHRDGSGRWVEDDLTLAVGPDGALRPKATAAQTVLGSKADGTVASAVIPAGAVSLRHLGALPVAALPRSNTATYPRALPGGVDLTVSATADGFEESVSLPDRSAGASYREELVVPAGITLANGAEGVELRDASRAVIATYGRGFAHDAAYPAGGPASAAVVSVRTVGSRPEGASTVATIEVSVDPAWLADAGRAFPVTIDPTFYLQTTAPGYDTLVVSGSGAATSYWTYPHLLVGTPDATTVERSYMRFDLSSIPSGPATWVSDSKLQIANWYSTDCAARGVTLYRLLGAFGPTTTWNNRPTPAAVAGTVTSGFGKGATGCPGDWVYLPTTAMAQDWVRNGAPNHGLEMRGNETDAASFKGFYSAEWCGSGCAPTLLVTWNRQSPAASPLAPVNAAAVTSDSPTLSVTPVVDPDANPVRYWFRATTSPDAEDGYQAVNSGWIDTASYVVPSGALADGETYWWHAYTWAGEPGTSPDPNPSNAPATAPTVAPTSFRVDLRLGTDGSQPYDSAGPVATNLSAGNLVTTVSGPAMASVGGPVGLSWTYNSNGPASAGLLGEYFNAPAGPTADFVAGAAPAMVRTDAQVVFNWLDSPGAAIGSDNYLVRWTGKLRAPVNQGGTYSLSVAHYDGVRIWVAGIKVMDRWTAVDRTESASSLTFALPSDGTPVDIRIEARNDAGPGGVLLGAYGPAAAGGIIIPPSWLSTGAPAALPVGWSMSPAAAVSARVGEGSAIVTGGDGATSTWRWGAGKGFTPPSGTTGVLARDTTGALTLHDGPATYAFDNDGALLSSTTSADDGSPAAAQYVWTGTPRRLTKITDPVSNNEIVLHYAATTTDAACPLKDGVRAPVGSLCTVTYWDQTQTKLLYNLGRQLARIENPDAEITDFSYGADGRLVTIRDPRAADVVANPLLGVADDNAVRSVITYTGAKVTRVVGPKPTTGLSPGRTYTYTVDPAVREAKVDVDGLAPSAGYARKVTFDGEGRTLTDADATAKVTTTEWVGAEGDVLAATTDPAGRKTTHFYDSAFNPTDTYGPAPSSCFGPTRLPNNTCAAMDRSTNTFDGGLAGLAGTFWDKATLVGPPRLHATIADANGALAASWPAGPPDPVLGPAWSARFSGEVTLAAASNLQIVATGSATLWVDEILVTPATTVAAGVHRLMIDYLPGAGPNRTIALERAAPGSGAWTALGGLRPAYGLVTRNVVVDTTTGSPPQVSAATFGGTGQPDPAYRLPATTVVDPDGEALTTAYTYENGGFLRPTTKTLPAANTWGYGYYGNSELRANPCGGASVNQGGKPKVTTAPDPDGAGPELSRLSEVVYDTRGRPVATRVTRVGTEPWNCVTYDARGRLETRTIAPYGSSLARLVTYNYAVGGDPRVASVVDGAGTISATTDLAGRQTSYTDATANTTTSTYDQPGRLIATAGPALGASTETTYDSASRPTAQKIDGATVATAAYDSAGELTTANHPLPGGNGTALGPVGRDGAGRTTSLAWTGPGAVAIASHSVTRSQSGRMMSQMIDAAAAGTFTYSTAGRLVGAVLPGHSLAYAYASTGGCGTMTAAGRNTNRTSVVDNGGTPITSCYDNADRLTSSSDAAVGTPGYDSHGNTTTLGTQTLAFDGADRHISTVTGASTVSYLRDATDRIIERRINGTAVARYGYSGAGDSPTITSWGLALVGKERSFALIGGAMLSKGGPDGDRWSYPNVHGDVMATANAAGLKVGATHTYDPFGQALGTSPDNRPGNFDYGWLGINQRPTETEAGPAVIEMGARPYVPSLGRFLGVDPVEGGSCSDYDYVCGDPVNGLDLDGKCGFFGNPFRRCNPKDDPSPYGPKFFCANVGCIVYQTNPGTGSVQWGITTFNGGRGFWSVTVYVNGRLVDAKPLYIKGIPHGRLPSSIAPPGSMVTIKATLVFNCYAWFPCRADSVSNVYVVPA